MWQNLVSDRSINPCSKKHEKYVLLEYRFKKVKVMIWLGNWDTISMYTGNRYRTGFHKVPCLTNKPSITLQLTTYGTSNSSGVKAAGGATVKSSAGADWGPSKFWLSALLRNAGVGVRRSLEDRCLDKRDREGVAGSSCCCIRPLGLGLGSGGGLISGHSNLSSDLKQFPYF